MKYYDVKVEALVPCTITYRIYAEDEQDALKQTSKKAPTSVKPHVLQKRDLKATVYEAGSSLIKFVKSFRT